MSDQAEYVATILVATGWSYPDLLVTPVDVVVAVARVITERNQQ